MPESVSLPPSAWDRKATLILAGMIAGVFLLSLLFSYIYFSGFGKIEVIMPRLLTASAFLTALFSLWFIAIADILANKFEGSKRNVWLAAAIFLPVIGFVLYLLSGRRQKLPQDASSERESEIITMKAITRVLFAMLFFSFLFSMAMKYPLNDPDVWWHLKTGDWILEHGEIPDDDYFAYTTPKPLTDQQVRGLRTQWLGDVVFALAEKAGGVGGVAIFRNLLLLLPMLILFLWMLRKGISYYAAMGIIALPAVLLIFQLFYAFERPQAFSFLFIMLAAMMLERLRTHSRGKFDYSMALLPLSMAVWSNLHAGFIVGNMVICIYFASEASMYAWRKYHGRDASAEGPGSIFYAICAVSILASFINPNTYHIFYEYFMGLSSKFFKDFAATVAGGGRASWVEQVVLEFKPLRYFYETLLYKWIMVFWLFTAYPLEPYNIPIPGVLFICLIIKYWAKRKVDFAEAVTVLFIWFLANYYARILMFALTILPFYMGKTLMEIKFPPINFKKVFMGAIALLVVLTGAFMQVTYENYLREVLKPRIAPSWITPWYPISASSFIEQQKIPGPMYNFYTWGGFLIWRLPQYKVFIDGRALNQDVSWTADAILKTFPQWRNQLEAYNINFILTPVVFRESGHIIPLAPALVQEDKWKLVFVQNNSAIFVRDVPKNRNIISRYNMDKRSVFLEIISTENLLLLGMPGNPTFNLSKADALFALGRYEEAKAIYSLFPQLASKQLEELTRRGY